MKGKQRAIPTGGKVSNANIKGKTRVSVYKKRRRKKWEGNIVR